MGRIQGRCRRRRLGAHPARAHSGFTLVRTAAAIVFRQPSNPIPVSHDDHGLPRQLRATERAIAAAMKQAAEPERLFSEVERQEKFQRMAHDVQFEDFRASMNFQGRVVPAPSGTLIPRLRATSPTKPLQLRPPLAVSEY